MECQMCESEFCYFCGGDWNSEHMEICPKRMMENAEYVERVRFERFRRRRRLRKKLRKGGIIGRPKAFIFVTLYRFKRRCLLTAKNIQGCTAGVSIR